MFRSLVGNNVKWRYHTLTVRVLQVPYSWTPKQRISNSSVFIQRALAWTTSSPTIIAERNETTALIMQHGHVYVQLTVNVIFRVTCQRCLSVCVCHIRRRPFSPCTWHSLCAWFFNVACTVRWRLLLLLLLTLWLEMGAVKRLKLILGFWQNFCVSNYSSFISLSFILFICNTFLFVLMYTVGLGTCLRAEHAKKKKEVGLKLM